MNLILFSWHENYIQLEGFLFLNRGTFCPQDEGKRGEDARYVVRE